MSAHREIILELCENIVTKHSNFNHSSLIKSHDGLVYIHLSHVDRISRNNTLEVYTYIRKRKWFFFTDFEKHRILYYKCDGIRTLHLPFEYSDNISDRLIYYLSNYEKYKSANISCEHIEKSLGCDVTMSDTIHNKIGLLS